MSAMLAHGLVKMTQPCSRVLIPPRISSLPLPNVIWSGYNISLPQVHDTEKSTPVFEVSKQNCLFVCFFNFEMSPVLKSSSKY